MGAKSVIEESKSEELVDDMQEDKVDANKLAALKAKNKAKQQETNMKIATKKERSLHFGLIGTGQGGSRLVESMYNLGYESVIVCNTASQDLKFINVPDQSKLLLKYTIGGASKELEIGKAAAEANRKEISELIASKLYDSQVNILCTSLGGGSGAGSVETFIDLLSAEGKPIVVITILPMDTEDSKTKSNALETLSKLSNYARSKIIHNLIVVDNAKIESIYRDVSQLDFYNVANKAIVEPLDAFNTLSSMPSSIKSLDPLEFSKVLIDGEGLSIYGEMTIDNYLEDTSIAEAIINNLDNNLLASSFNLKQSKYAATIIAANKNVWAKIPSSSINYAMAMINDKCSNPSGVFKGIYTIDLEEDVVKVWSMFSGLGLPDQRVEQLKKDVAEQMNFVKSKDEKRNMTLQLDTGTEQTISEAQKIKNKIAAKSSTFGKFLANNVTDRRK